MAYNPNRRKHPSRGLEWFDTDPERCDDCLGDPEIDECNHPYCDECGNYTDHHTDEHTYED